MSAGPLESWRLFFPTAAALAVLGLVAWGAQLAGVPLGLVPADHAGHMVWGVFGSGILGFLLTAYPRQNDAPMPSATRLWSLLGLQMLSVATLLLGRGRVPSEARVVLAALPWIGTLVWILPVARASLSRRWDDTTAAIPVALVAALVGVVLHVLDGRPLLVEVEIRGISFGVGPFVAVMALAVLDRVLPFFSARAAPDYAGRRTAWFLGPLTAFAWGKAVFPAHGHWFAAGLLALLVRQWWGWRPWPAARIPMVGALHLGIGWIALGWAADMVGAPPTVGTHALLVGGITTLLFAVSMRVVRGHSGLPVVLGRAGAVVLVLAQLAAALRVWLGWAGGAVPLYVASAALLAMAFAVWLARFGRVAFRRVG